MEEVDKIIIDSLRHLKCDIDEDISSLKQFEPDNVVAAIATCLELINSQLKLPRKLPTSMSARIRFASSLAEQIKQFGFKGDMGYQTILYCNEYTYFEFLKFLVEVRRVLMFLLERLPKEQSPTASTEPLGYVPRTVKQIEDQLRLALNQIWLPSEALYSGTRITKTGVVVNSLGSSCPVEAVKLIVANEEIASVPFVTQQCLPDQLLPSLLFQTDFLVNANWKQLIAELPVVTTGSISKSVLDSFTSISEDAEIRKESENTESGLVNSVEELLTKFKTKKATLTSLQEDVKELEEKLQKLKNQREIDQKALEESLVKAQVKKKTLAVLSNEENKVKLKNLISKAENRLTELAEQWNEVQSPLLEEHQTLKSSVSFDGIKYQNEHNKLHNLKKSYKEMVTDYKQKCSLEVALIGRCKELNNTNHRAAYTKRILEIVGNTKKQNQEIQKILADTRQVQKEINNLTGQVDRSFTLCDEIIFRDCKHDESARKAYKLLAALREECNGILQSVADMGQAERELRNLEEQIETEKNKDIQNKLGKVQIDLAEIRKEIETLM